MWSLSDNALTIMARARDWASKADSHPAIPSGRLEKRLRSQNIDYSSQKSECQKLLQPKREDKEEDEDPSSTLRKHLPKTQPGEKVEEDSKTNLNEIKTQAVRLHQSVLKNSEQPMSKVVNLDQPVFNQKKVVNFDHPVFNQKKLQNLREETPPMETLSVEIEDPLGNLHNYDEQTVVVEFEKVARDSIRIFIKLSSVVM